MKHSLTASPGALAALFDLLANSLGSRPSVASPSSAPRESPSGRSLVDRFERALWRARQREADRYLSQAVDVYDLEDRMRRLGRSGQWPYY